MWLHIPILLIQTHCHCWLLTVFILDPARPTTPPSATTFLLRNWMMMSSSSMWTLLQLFFFKHISCVFQVLILDVRVYVFRDLWDCPGGSSPASWISSAVYLEVKHMICSHPTHRKNTFLYLPSSYLDNDISWNAKRSRQWNMFDSLHFNPQTGLARYNDLFDRHAFVYDPTRTWQQHHRSLCTVFSNWSIPHSPWTQQSQEPFWQRQIRKLLELLVPAPLACCQGLTSMLTRLCICSQPMFACHKDAVYHKCILYPSVGLRLTHAFPSFKTVFNVFSQNKVLLWVGSQDAKGEFWAGEELHACLLGLDMTPLNWSCSGC